MTIRGPLRAKSLALAFSILPLRLDDPKHSGSQPPLPLPIPGANDDSKDPHAEMRRLFGTIEKDLRQIDRLLAEASSGSAATGDAGNKAAEAIAGIAKLLERSEEQSRTVVAGIDRILELANHPHQPGSSGEP
jgi:hypothetical protein